VNLSAKRILLIVSGGIAAYKALELIRLITKAGGAVTCVLTQAGSQFVTPLSLQALSGAKIYTDLFSLTDDSEMGHIELSRAADLVAVVPATANILAKMAAGICDDLATTLLLATDKRVLVAPAMNVRMWEHPATIENQKNLAERLRRIRLRSACRAGNHPGCDRRRTRRGRPARRQARHRHLRPDA
jgi:phosphopantothenoylcysteine decarboxylase/phosphopantothenate--cysteine ligase